MSIQYEDGSFSELLTFEEMVKRCDRELKNGIKVKAIHFVGSQEELNEKKAEMSLEERVAKLERYVKEISPVISPLTPIL